MQRMFFKLLLIAALATVPADAQSLGDIARANQEKKAVDGSTATTPKVITNKDLPKDPEAGQGSSQAPPAPTKATGSQAADARAQQRSAQQGIAQQRMAEQRAGDQWKAQILAQKNRMAVMQARIDLLNASIRQSYGSVQYDAPYNRAQARQLERVAQMQQQLGEQKMKLVQMQDAARHAGMHTLVYDP